MSKDSTIKSPFYYVKKRLFSNYPAIFGMVVIVIAVLLAFFGYLIIPDKTHDANDGVVMISKKGPGFSTTILRERKHMEIKQGNFFENMIFGNESEYTIIPIEEYKINGFEVSFKTLGSKQQSTLHLINIVKPLFIGNQKHLPNHDKEGNFLINGDNVQYVDIYNKLQKTTQKELVKEFEKNNIQERYYLLGTDKMGRDLLSRLVLGTRISLTIGFMSVLIALMVGITLGSLAGFFGGIVDRIVMWFMTVVWSIPGIMLVVAISLALDSRGLWTVFIAVGLTTWVEIARIARGQIMEIKQKQYVEAARALGVKNYRIVTKHIFPNLFGSFIVIISANFASAILIEAGLSFLGMGVQPPTSSLGVMIYEGHALMGTDDMGYLIFYPSLFISLLVLAFNLLGNGLRDAYDPKTLVK